MDPSCLFTADEGESGTQTKYSEQANKKRATGVDTKGLSHTAIILQHKQNPINRIEVSSIKSNNISKAQSLMPSTA